MIQINDIGLALPDQVCDLDTVLVVVQGDWPPRPSTNMNNCSHRTAHSHCRPASNAIDYIALVRRGDKQPIDVIAADSHLVSKLGYKCYLKVVASVGAVVVSQTTENGCMT